MSQLKDIYATAKADALFRFLSENKEAGARLVEILDSEYDIADYILNGEPVRDDEKIVNYLKKNRSGLVKVEINEVKFNNNTRKVEVDYIATRKVYYDNARNKFSYGKSTDYPIEEIKTEKDFSSICYRYLR